MLLFNAFLVQSFFTATIVLAKQRLESEIRMRPASILRRVDLIPHAPSGERPYRAPLPYVAPEGVDAGNNRYVGGSGSGAGGSDFNNLLHAGTEQLPHGAVFESSYNWHDQHNAPSYAMAPQPEFVTYDTRNPNSEAQVEPPPMLQRSYLYPQPDEILPSRAVPIAEISNQGRSGRAKYRDEAHAIAVLGPDKGRITWKRIVRNRQAALDSRQRKKTELDKNKKENKDLKADNKDLVAVNQDLMGEISRIREESRQDKMALIARISDLERMNVALMNERQRYVPHVTPIGMPVGQAEGATYLDLSNTFPGFSTGETFEMYPAEFDPSAHDVWNPQYFHVQPLVDAMDSPDNLQRRSLHRRRENMHSTSAHSDTATDRAVSPVRRSNSDPASEFAFYMHIYSEVQTNVSMLLFPYFASVLNQTQSRAIYDMVWSVYSDLVALGPYIIGPYSNGKTSFVWMQQQMFGNYTGYSKNDTEAADDVIAEQTVLTMIYSAVWGNATKIANSTGYLKQMETLRGYLSPANASIMPDTWTKSVNNTPAEYFTNLYNRSMFS